jgi:hypothetical protein
MDTIEHLTEDNFETIVLRRACDMRSVVHEVTTAPALTKEVAV